MSPARSAATVAVGLALCGGSASAHPLDEVIQAAYLTIAPGEIQLDLEIQPGILVAQDIARVVDANGDRRISPAEARAYGERTLRNSSLTVDGGPATLRLVNVETPPYAQLAQGYIMHIHAVATRRDRVGARVFAYLNRYAPLKSQYQANVFLSAGSGWTFDVASQGHSPDGRGLTVAYRAVRAS